MKSAPPTNLPRTQTLLIFLSSPQNTNLSNCNSNESPRPTSYHTPGVPPARREIFSASNCFPGAKEPMCDERLHRAAPPRVAMCKRADTGRPWVEVRAEGGDDLDAVEAEGSIIKRTLLAMLAYRISVTIDEANPPDTSVPKPTYEGKYGPHISHPQRAGNAHEQRGHVRTLIPLSSQSATLATPLRRLKLLPAQ